jgi:crotonyl-CoA carboxylase/reductase
VTTLVGATAFRMLTRWTPHVAKKGNVVLIWGGTGGLVCMAIQIAKAMGALPLAVVSGKQNFEACIKLGAIACIDRNGFDHWGVAPDPHDQEASEKWIEGVKAFGKAIREAVGGRVNPRIVVEHPGRDTLPTSLFVCDTDGMVVTCGATTGFRSFLDLRYLWMRQKRFQGSHFASHEDVRAFHRMVLEGSIDPCLTRVYEFDELPEAHQALYENTHSRWRSAVRIGR